MSSPPDGSPQFSIIIPTCNRPTRLRECLESLAALDYPRDRFEIIVSDDGSTTPVESLAAAFSDRLAITVISHPENTGPGAARNRGAARARGRYLVFIDDDCIPVREWLTVLAGRFASRPDYLIGGAIVNALMDNPFSAATQLLMTYVYQYHDRRGDGKHFFNTGNLAAPAEGFRNLQGFSEMLPLAEDYDFCQRWLNAGYRMLYAPEAMVYHRHDLTLASFSRQHYRYGRGLFRCRLRMATRTRQRFKGETPSFYLGLLLFPLKHGVDVGRWTQTALIGLSQAATVSGVIREALDHSWRRMVSRRQVEKTDSQAGQ